MPKINSIYDYLRWRGLNLLIIWCLIPLVSGVLCIIFAGDRLNDLSPHLRVACLVTLLGVMGGGPLTYLVLMLRTACPRCRRALGSVAFLRPDVIFLRGSSSRCPHCGIDIFAPMDSPANLK
jgi:hypothetical protein